MANAKLPSPELVHYYKDYQERRIYIDYDIDDTIFEVTKQILAYNREDRDKHIDDNGSDVTKGDTKSCGCLKQGKSSIEYKVNQYFLNHNINFEAQYKFDALKGIHNGQLSYDFYVPEFNLLVECQGQQHEKPIEYFGGEEQFVIQQEHDRRKREYAKNNGYGLLEIWYYDYDNIDKILDKELSINSNIKEFDING